MAKIIPTDPFEAYRKGWQDGASSDPRYGKISFWGYDLGKLCEIISDYESRQSKVLFETSDKHLRVEKIGDDFRVWVDNKRIW